MAAIPVWWDYPVLTDQDWDQLKFLAEFVADIDFANQPYKPLTVAAEGADLYVMGTNRDAFGWGRSYKKEDISGSELSIQGLTDDSYTISWYDAWSGQIIKSTTAKPQEGKLVLEVPKMTEVHADVAFKIRKN